MRTLLSNRKLVCRIAYHGCTNRPFFHIVIQYEKMPRNGKIKEQVGVYDPMLNSNNERLLAVNLDRIRYHMQFGTKFSKPVLRLLGVAGFLPFHPSTMLEVHRANKKLQTDLNSVSDSEKTETEQSVAS